MKLFISQSNFIPWRGFFHSINTSDLYIILDSVQYTKNSFRNRNLILKKDNQEWITLPVHYKHSLKQKINEIAISNPKWHDLILSKLSNCYGESKFYKDIMHVIEHSINQLNTNNLSVVNKALLRMVTEYYKIKTEIIEDTIIDFNLSKSERLVDACKIFGASTYITTTTALNYLDIKLFQENSIDVEIIGFDKCLSPYNQSSFNFKPYVSIIDFMFNEGPAGQHFFEN